MSGGTARAELCACERWVGQGREDVIFPLGRRPSPLGRAGLLRSEVCGRIDKPNALGLCKQTRMRYRNNDYRHRHNDYQHRHSDDLETLTPIISTIVALRSARVRRAAGRAWHARANAPIPFVPIHIHAMQQTAARTDETRQRRMPESAACLIAACCPSHLVNMPRCNMERRVATRCGTQSELACEWRRVACAARSALSLGRGRRPRACQQQHERRWKRHLSPARAAAVGARSLASRRIISRWCGGS
jgi:hypothetical protein